MNADFKKIADAIEKSSSETKNLMFSVDFAERVGRVLEANNLDEETGLKIIDEVSYVILGLKNRFLFTESLIEIGVDKITATQISKEIEKNVFSELDKIKKPSNNMVVSSINNEPENAKGAQQKQSNIGSDFEQVIMNQAKAMMPARPKDETGGGTRYEVRGTIEEGSENPNTENNRKVHDYAQGADPYREPLG